MIATVDIFADSCVSNLIEVYIKINLTLWYCNSVHLISYVFSCWPSGSVVWYKTSTNTRIQMHIERNDRKQSKSHKNNNNKNIITTQSCIYSCPFLYNKPLFITSYCRDHVSCCNIYAVQQVTYLLTPWSRVLLEKLTGFAANQEIPRILWNPKVHYRAHKRPPPVPILS